MKGNIFQYLEDQLKFHVSRLPAVQSLCLGVAIPRQKRGYFMRNIAMFIIVIESLLLSLLSMSCTID